MATLKLATYNVNGITSRLANLLEWLQKEAPDIACLQELKAPDERFPEAAIQAAGYEAIWHGQRSWNGVAILARGTKPIETRRGLPGNPADDQSRYLEAAVEGVLVGCLYAPNGNPQPGPKFDYKLAWMERLLAHAESLYASGHPVVLAGDYNVIPTDFDIYDTRSWKKDALLQPQTRELYAAAPGAGLGRRAARPSSRGAHLYLLGLLPPALAAQFRAAHRPPAAQPDTRGWSTRAWIAGCAASRTRATMRPPG